MRGKAFTNFIWEVCSVQVDLFYSPCHLWQQDTRVRIRFLFSNPSSRSFLEIFFLPLLLFYTLLFYFVSRDTRSEMRQAVE